jgi:hypothetical protein
MIQDIKTRLKYWFINLRIRLRTTVEDTLGMPPRPGNRISDSTQIWKAVAKNTCPNCRRKNTLGFSSQPGRDLVCSKCDFFLCFSSRKSDTKNQEP